MSNRYRLRIFIEGGDYESISAPMELFEDVLDEYERSYKKEYLKYLEDPDGALLNKLEFQIIMYPYPEYQELQEEKWQEEVRKKMKYRYKITKELQTGQYEYTIIGQEWLKTKEEALKRIHQLEDRTYIPQIRYRLEECE